MCYIHIKEKLWWQIDPRDVPTSPNKPNGNGQKYRHNTKMADVILKFSSDNSKKCDTTLPYLNFVFNPTINRKTS